MNSEPDVLEMPEGPFDVIVIGSGMGGLTTAALLARHGRRVLVLEQHYVAGGCATAFRRPGFEFEVGVHYIGDCGPEDSVPRILRAAGVKDAQFNELDADGFDTLIFPDFTFRVPRGVDHYRERLLEQFPAERAGIDRYLGLLRGIGSLSALGGGTGRVLGTLWQALPALPYLNSTLAKVFARCTANERLRAVWAAHSPDYAQPPSRVSFGMHATITMSYLRGAYYPAGGAQCVTNRLVAALKQNGGSILLRAKVSRILVDRGMVTGVEFHHPSLGTRTVSAPVVVSDADVKETFLHFIAPEHLRAKTVERVRGYEMSPALGVVYLGVKRDLRAEGMPATNFWVHPNYDQEPMYAEARSGRFHPNPVCAVFCANLKDPDNDRLAPAGMSNLEIGTIVPSQPEAWGTTAEELASGAYEQNPAYQRTKQTLAQRLIAQAEVALPGLAGTVEFCEVSSPLTHTRYTSSTGGTSYGIAPTPAQSLWHRPSTRTEIRGLFLCGASAQTGHGILGTMWSGVYAASQIAGASILREANARCPSTPVKP